MVVLGGVTRLTRSGLSMTDWKFQWESPPLCAEDWAREFAKYRASPEFRLSNASMTVDEYKFIFWMEYGHRMWGRGLGVFFALPLCAFLAKGWITKRLGARLVSFFGLGAAQGAIGWWMVKSGLTLDAENPLHVPRVSPYRLATHLTGAFTIYTAMLWTTFSVLFPETNGAGGGGVAAKNNAAFADAAATSLRRKAFPLAGLIAVTALSGAYVAGLDAGRAYNTFPLMDGKVVPELYWAQFEEKGWRNFFENDAAVQFDHRALALATLASTSATLASTSKAAMRALPKRATFFLHATAGLVTAQVALGIATLLCHVPVSLGSAHQANALLVFTAAVGLTHALKTKRPNGAARVAAATARGTQGTAAKKIAAEHAHAGVPVRGGRRVRGENRRERFRVSHDACIHPVRVKAQSRFARSVPDEGVFVGPGVTSRRRVILLLLGKGLRPLPRGARTSRRVPPSAPWATPSPDPSGGPCATSAPSNSRRWRRAKP